MTIEWLRDLVIVIFGIAATIMVIGILALAFMFYSRVRPIIASVQKTTRTVEKISSSVEEEIVKPLAHVASFIQGIRQAISMVSRFTKRKEED
jgi:hypothetical protein